MRRILGRMAVAAVDRCGTEGRRVRLTAVLALVASLISVAPALAGAGPSPDSTPAAPAMQPDSWRATPPVERREVPPASATIRSADCVGVDLVKALQSSDPASFDKFEAAARNVANGQGLLWRIEGRGAKPSYLFGTMHSSEAIARTFDDLVLRAIARSRVVATELPGASTRKVAAELRRLVAARSLRVGGDSLDALPSEVRRQVETRLSQVGVPVNVAAQLQPWYLALTLSRSRCAPADVGVDTETADARIERFATEQGSALMPLETPVEQVDALASIPDETALRMLKEATLKDLKPEDVEETISGLYSARRIGYILAMRGPMWAGFFDADGYADFISAFITRRNATMLQRALPIIADGEAFLAVGALHLPGDSGLVEMIRRSGYSVTRIW